MDRVCWFVSRNNAITFAVYRAWLSATRWFAALDAEKSIIADNLRNSDGFSGVVNVLMIVPGAFELVVGRVRGPRN